MGSHLHTERINLVDPELIRRIVEQSRAVGDMFAVYGRVAKSFKPMIDAAARLRLDPIKAGER